MRLAQKVIGILAAAGAGALVVGVMSTGGISAAFTASNTSSQTVNAGTIGWSVWSSNGGSGCNEASDHCTDLTLPAIAAVGSTFETNATDVYVTNTGNIPITFDSLQMSESHGNNSASVNLRNQLNVCIMMHDTDNQVPNYWTEGNGPLTVATLLNPTVKENPIALQPGESAHYKVSFYAGQDSTCGAKYSDGTNTAGAWSAAVGKGYTTPQSLTNAAMGGQVTATLTFSVTA